jgi:DNA-binding SARP family transcriptional activator/tetratricopeptide (TPR) repeat protein
MELEFRVLGPLHIMRDEAPVALGATMLRRLLAAMLCRSGGPVSVNALIGALWGAAPPQSARKTLQVYVRRLRQAIGEDGRILHGAGGYALAVAPREVDALRFAELTVAARAARGRAEPESAGALFERALGLWRGPAYLDLEDVPLVADEVRRLEEERLLAYEDLTAVNLLLGRDAELIADLTEMTRIHPYRERMRAHLMVALCQAGRQVEALDVYHRTRLALREELGVEPGQMLRKVHEAVLRDGCSASVAGQIMEWTSGADGHEPGSVVGGPHPAYREPHLASPGPFPAVADDVLAGFDTGLAVPGSDVPEPVPSECRLLAAEVVEPVLLEPAVAVPCHLPPDIADFTGREAEVESLCGSLTGTGARGATAIVTVAGRAGVGKTALAVHVAHRLRETFPDGRLYVDLHGADARPLDPDEALARFLVALGVPARALPAGLEERAELFRTLSASRRMLVILDDAAGEHQIRSLLPGGPRCAVLVTSRRRLTGLSSRPLLLDGFDHESALALLARTAGAERAGTDSSAAAEIVRLCDHLPLAVRIAGARLAGRPHWSLGHLADRLRDPERRLDELAAGDLSVRGGLTAGYRSLDRATRRAFRLLSLLDAPGFAAWATAALLDVTVREAETLTESLVDAQLLRCAGTDARGLLRYHFDDLERLFARERAESEDGAAVRHKAITRALGAWLSLADVADQRLTERVAADIRGMASRWYLDPEWTRALVSDALEWFDTERGALAACVSQACAAGLDEVAWELAARAVNYYAYRGRYEDWSATHGLALRTCAQTGNRWGEAVMARNLACLRVTGMRKPPGLVRKTMESALVTFQESGERHGLVDALGFHAFALSRGGDLDGALAQADAAMSAAQLIGYELGQSRMWYLRAVTAREQGRHADAAACAEQHVELATRVGTLQDRVLALWELAASCRDRGSLHRVTRELRGCLEICREREELLLEGYLLLALADLEMRFGRGRPEESIRRGLAVFEEYAVHFGEAVGSRLLGECHRRGGEPERALPHLVRAVQLAEELRKTHEQALALSALGRAQHACGDHAAAGRSWRTAHRLYGRLGNRTESTDLAAALETCERDQAVATGSAS